MDLFAAGLIDQNAGEECGEFARGVPRILPSTCPVWVLKAAFHDGTPYCFASWQ